MVVLLTYLILAIASMSNAEFRNDAGVVWAPGCRIQGSMNPGTPGVTTKKTTKERCSTECYLDPECTHFTWAFGSCFMQRDSGVVGFEWIYEELSLCGYLNSKWISINGLMLGNNYLGTLPPYGFRTTGNTIWAYSCDIPDSSFLQIKMPRDWCSSLCSWHPDCNVFTWRGGICYLKRGSGRITFDWTVDYSMVCGYLKEKRVCNTDMRLSKPSDVNMDTTDLQAVGKVGWNYGCQISGTAFITTEMAENDCKLVCLWHPECLRFNWYGGVCYILGYAARGSIGQSNDYSRSCGQVIEKAYCPSP